MHSDETVVDCCDMLHVDDLGTMGVEITSENNDSTICGGDLMERRGMVLPFQPLSLAFNHVNYSIDVPAGSYFSSYQPD